MCILRRLRFVDHSWAGEMKSQFPAVTWSRLTTLSGPKAVWNWDRPFILYDIRLITLPAVWEVWDSSRPFILDDAMLEGGVRLLQPDGFIGSTSI